MEAGGHIEPGQRVLHGEFGEGVVISIPSTGFVRAFFGIGERQVPLESLKRDIPRSERVIASVASSTERIRKAWLTYEAFALPLMDSAAALTSAKIDLLPHQVVLTHRVATATPRRFLIADEVGLGKTIETALILRELASRGELERAIMIVPAGLVNNWHRELNEVFNLNFEVFGSEGDVTDRKSNAFLKHNRLIASVDTLKREARIKRLLAAPPWDLVVFDEAHHLTAYESGKKLRKTENYRLAEALKGHTRDLLLLSATPHQGDNFRFWMLIQLLDTSLFASADDMVVNRHRLNSVIFRRTKADACKPDGTPLFARRDVHTESFVMSEAERTFYEELRQYLEDGFELAKKSGNQGRGLGFVMAIFQKIAASSFAAVRRTLRRRLLGLTVYEAVLQDRNLDIESRQALLAEAKALIREEYNLGDDPVSRSEIDKILADIKLKVVRELDEEALGLASDEYVGESASVGAEEMAATSVKLSLPHERSRIRNLLASAPAGREVKIEKLLAALGVLWRQNPGEKVVIFATYLGTVDLIGKEIEKEFPGQGVVVLRGGDHGAKLAAEKRFKLNDGPKVLVCTAAGREGINLQFARVLFNFDLPWNPMDIEQRIGRIHRYGQIHTAQVYNLVLSDTIEGRIFLLLDEKLHEIAKTLGKVDEDGKVAEDLRSQILGQLSERISYEKLYQDALSDPELKRTRLELEAALANASEARHVVFELFQDLEGFSLDDYQPFADISEGTRRVVDFAKAAAQEAGDSFKKIAESEYELTKIGNVPVRLSVSREQAIEREDIGLLGLDHPYVQEKITAFKSVRPEEIAVSLSCDLVKKGEMAIFTAWYVEVNSGQGDRRSVLLNLAVKPDGSRLPALERKEESLFMGSGVNPVFSSSERLNLLHNTVEGMLTRELSQRGLLREGGGFSAQLVSWLELIGSRE